QGIQVTVFVLQPSLDSGHLNPAAQIAPVAPYRLGSGTDRSANEARAERGHRRSQHFVAGARVLRSFARGPRFVIVAVVAYVITAASEFLWYLATGPSFTGFESPTAEQATDAADTAEHLAAQLRTLPPTELRAEALEFAKELKDFEAGT